MRSITLTTTGAAALLTLDEGSTLEQLQRAVGGFIQVLQLTDELALVCDEEVKLKAHERNEVATKLTALFEVGLAAGDYIGGPAVLIGTSSSGATVDVPASAAAALELLDVEISDGTSS